MNIDDWLTCCNTKMNEINDSSILFYSESNIHFPVYISMEIYDKKINYGSIVEFQDNKLEESNNKFISFNLSFTQDGQNNSSILSDLDDSKNKIISVIKDLILKQSDKKNHYNESIDFLKFDYTVRLNLITDENANIEDTSYSLAFAFGIVDSAIRKYANYKNNIGQICLTGIFKNEDGNWIIDKVSGIKEKIIAVLCTNIKKFVVPESNRAEVLAFLKNSKDCKKKNIFINKGEKNQLEIIFSSTFSDVLNTIYEANFFETSFFKNTFDLGYRYRQKTLNSSLVKIKNVFNLFNDQNNNENIENYVKLKVLDKEKTLLSLEPHEIFSDVKEYDIRNIVILGEAGSGKTSLLKNFLSLICTEKIKGFDKLPVFLEFNSFDTKKYNVEIDGNLKNNFIKEVLVNHLNKIDLNSELYINFLEDLNKQKKLIFLFDAYDEKNIDSNYFSQENLCIISSRHHDKLSGNFYEVLPMEDQARNKFILNYLKKYIVIKDENENNFLEKILKLELKKVFSNPLFLSLFLLIITDDEEYLKDEFLSEIKIKGRLINLAINKFLSKKSKKSSSLDNFQKFESEKTKKDLILEFLKEIAFEIFQNKEKKDILEKNKVENLIIDKIIPKINLIQENQFFLDKFDIPHIMDYLSNSSGIIEEIKDIQNNKTTFKFFHEIFYEFFLAKYSIENSSNFEKWVINNKFNLKCTNIFRLITTLIEIEEENEISNNNKKLDYFLELIENENKDEYGNINDLLLVQLLYEMKIKKSSEALKKVFLPKFFEFNNSFIIDTQLKALSLLGEDELNEIFKNIENKSSDLTRKGLLIFYYHAILDKNISLTFKEKFITLIFEMFNNKHTDFIKIRAVKVLVKLFIYYDEFSAHIKEFEDLLLLKKDVLRISILNELSKNMNSIIKNQKIPLVEKLIEEYSKDNNKMVKIYLSILLAKILTSDNYSEIGHNSFEEKLMKLLQTVPNKIWVKSFIRKNIFELIDFSKKTLEEKNILKNKINEVITIDNKSNTKKISKLNLKIKNNNPLVLEKLSKSSIIKIIKMANASEILLDNIDNYDKNKLAMKLKSYKNLNLLITTKLFFDQKMKKHLENYSLKYTNPYYLKEDQWFSFDQELEKEISCINISIKNL